jgi:hypothetical protein
VSVRSSLLVYIYLRLIFPLSIYIYMSVWSSPLVYICVRQIFLLCFYGGLLFILIVYICVCLIFPNVTPRKQRGKIRRTNIYTKGENQKDKYIYTIRLNTMTPRKQRGEIRRTNIYTKGEDLCCRGVTLFNLIVYIFVRLIFPLSTCMYIFVRLNFPLSIYIYMCPSDLPPFVLV